MNSYRRGPEPTRAHILLKALQLIPACSLDTAELDAKRSSAPCKCILYSSVSPVLSRLFWRSIMSNIQLYRVQFTARSTSS